MENPSSIRNEGESRNNKKKKEKYYSSLSIRSNQKNKENHHSNSPSAAYCVVPKLRVEVVQHAPIGVPRVNTLATTKNWIQRIGNQNWILEPLFAPCYDFRGIQEAKPWSLGSRTRQSSWLQSCSLPATWDQDNKKWFHEIQWTSLGRNLGHQWTTQATLSAMDYS